MREGTFGSRFRRQIAFTRAPRAPRKQSDQLVSKHSQPVAVQPFRQVGACCSPTLQLRYFPLPERSGLRLGELVYSALRSPVFSETCILHAASSKLYSASQADAGVVSANQQQPSAAGAAVTACRGQIPKPSKSPSWSALSPPPRLATCYPTLATSSSIFPSYSAPPSHETLIAAPQHRRLLRMCR